MTMSLSTIVALIPVIVTLIEILKRFIPDQHRTWANPLLAIVIAAAGAYSTAGTAGLLEVIMTALTAAGGAMAAYKVPKMVGAKLGIDAPAPAPAPMKAPAKKGGK
jgi:hypothetical protein